MSEREWKKLYNWYMKGVDKSSDDWADFDTFVSWVEQDPLVYLSELVNNFL